MKILLVDDNDDNRTVLCMVLTSDGHEVLQAANGQEGVDIFKEESPDLVLMDLRMPVMDGLAATKLIKEHHNDQLHVPILFLTGQSDDQTLSECLAIGGDDFLYKPISTQVLRAKIKAHARIRELNSQLNDQKDELTRLYDNMLHEQELAKTVFQRAMKASVKENANIRHVISPASIFSGDIVLSAYSPSGGIYVLVADFTGHGLPAAIGGLPVSQIFYEAAASGDCVSDIARKLNKTLESFLPDEMFAAAAILEMNAAGSRVTVWTGGMPNILVSNSNGHLKEIIKSQHVPLGIASDEDFKREVIINNVARGDKIYICTDGIIEAKNSAGERYGKDRLISLFDQDKADLFDEIIQDSERHCQNSEQTDDITVVEVSCRPIDQKEAKKVETKPGETLPLTICVNLDAEKLKGRSPISQLTDMLTVPNHIAFCKDELHTILTELFSNAFEHGVLDLSSNIKEEDGGYIDYYDQRQQKIDELEEGNILIKIDFLTENDHEQLKITFQDSGKGFDINKLQKSSQHALSGRGISLVRALSERVEYGQSGNNVTVYYDINKHTKH